MNKRIGFYYINDPNWSGGKDYVLNAINSLNFLDFNKQPEVDILVDETIVTDELKTKITYPKCEIYKIRTYKNRFIRLLNLIFQKFRWKFVYPFPKANHFNHILGGVPSKRRIYWVPDFQEEYFPELFEKRTVEKRRKMRKSLASQETSIVVFSSINARNDFIKFYGPDIFAKTKVLNFANPNIYKFSQKQIYETLTKYGVKKEGFFICPNQFWKHKNHGLVIEAVRELHRKGNPIVVLFCGREEDPRDFDYFPKLRKSAEDLVDLGVLKFLGFLPKEDQMCLISESKALIQPSLFEGWSTTIEDAISLNKPVLAADLEVNKEQLGGNGFFFKSTCVDDFIVKIEEIKKIGNRIDYNNINRVIDFAESLINLDFEQ
jgi:glycosyltransferase involved in cell wall biosynthesis